MLLVSFSGRSKRTRKSFRSRNNHKSRYFAQRKMSKDSSCGTSKLSAEESSVDEVAVSVVFFGDVAASFCRL